MDNNILKELLNTIKRLEDKQDFLIQQNEEFKSQLNRVEEKQDKIFIIVKRSETKLTHTMDVFEVNTKEASGGLFYIENDDAFELKVKHKDVTVGQLEEFFTGKNGLFVIEMGEQQWKIIL